MKKRLLVVDDDPAVLEAMTRLLVAEGYEVLAARDGAGALRHFNAGPVDLVVLDLNLGTDDGWDVFRKMAEAKPVVPTVIITAECAQRELARAAGVEALVEKPIDVPVFLEIVRDLLAERGEQRWERICGSDGCCRYVGRSYETFLRLLQERRSAPMKLSWGSRATAGDSPAAGAGGFGAGQLSVVAGSLWDSEQRKGASS